MHGLLRTLEQSGLVSQDVATGRYSLGPRVLQLGNAYLAGSELRARSMLRAGALAPAGRRGGLGLACSSTTP